MPNALKIKVCGMRNLQNITAVAQLGIDFMGFIFFKKSKRYVDQDFDKAIPASVQPHIKTVGVFVNEDLEVILQLKKRYNLDYVQLHGDESVEYCRQASEAGLNVIKAFGVDENFNFERIQAYENFVEFFLFDTKSSDYGGTGRKFDWEMLNNYQLSKPFMLSGGLESKDAQIVLALEHPKLFAIDLNSKFEISPANKDVGALQGFKEALNFR